MMKGSPYGIHRVLEPAGTLPQAILRNYQGNIFAYAQPPKHYTDPDEPCKLCGKAHLGISTEKCINGK